MPLRFTLREPSALGFFSATLALILPLLCTSCVFGRILYFNVPSLSAPSYFDNREVAPSPSPTPLARQAVEARLAVPASRRATYRSIDDLLSENGTRAFVVLHHDSIVYERYFGGITAETRLPSFSMSKTFAAALIGCAVDDGLFTSPDEHLVSSVPELSRKPGYSDITIDQLLRMTSGIDFAEESAAAAILYYTEDLHAEVRKYGQKWPAGTHYQYGSVNIQLLWEALHRKLGDRTVTDYFEKRFWGPLGAEHAAAWSLDSRAHGVEKLFGGLSATARDYARLGILFQHRGEIGGRRVLPASWVVASIAPDPVAGVVRTSDGDVQRGRYQWFWTLDGTSYFSKGYHGQYVFVDEVRDVVIVRFGEGYGDVDWMKLFASIASSL